MWVFCEGCYSLTHHCLFIPPPSGRTEKEAVQEAKLGSRTQPEFTRMPSRRYQRRIVEGAQDSEYCGTGPVFSWNKVNFSCWYITHEEQQRKYVWIIQFFILVIILYCTSTVFYSQLFVSRNGISLCVLHYCINSLLVFYFFFFYLIIDASETNTPQSVLLYPNTYSYFPCCHIEAFRCWIITKGRWYVCVCVCSKNTNVMLYHYLWILIL